jgi:HSP20 family protein
MTTKREPAPLVPRSYFDPLAMMRDMTFDFDRFFEEPRWPLRFLPRALRPAGGAWFPEIDVFEKDHRLVTKIDLPGLKKEDVKVEVADGILTITGERIAEAKEETENVYRCERSYGSFSRTVPLPAGVTSEQVTATFADGVLEVTVPLPAKAESTKHTVQITDGAKAAKAA